MKLEYDLIEESYDDTTHLRTMTEQAETPWGGWLIRTTTYSPHYMSSDVVYVSVPDGAAKKGFDPVVSG